MKNGIWRKNIIFGLIYAIKRLITIFVLYFLSQNFELRIICLKKNKHHILLRCLLPNLYFYIKKYFSIFKQMKKS